MTTAQEKMELAKDRLSTNADRLKTIGAVYKFVLEGEGGGTWIANFRDTPSIETGDGEAECTIIMNAQDYVDMVEGRANPQQLFFTGKLKVEGDMGLAMKLGDIADIMK
jgi:putative sterol carrier protein